MDRDITAIKAKIGVDTYETARDAGQRLTLDEEVAFAVGWK